MCKGIARREFDLVAAWAVDRLGRSLQELVGFLGELHGKSVDLYLHQQGIDTSTPAGKAMSVQMTNLGPAGWVADAPTTTTRLPGE